VPQIVEADVTLDSGNPKRRLEYSLHQIVGVEERATLRREDEQPAATRPQLVLLQHLQK
jgi:hypothetical protein